MTAAFHQVVAEFYPKLAVSRPQPFKLRLDKRATANRMAMRAKRAAWHLQGLNSHGKPLKGNHKFRNQRFLKLPK